MTIGLFVAIIAGIAYVLLIILSAAAFIANRKD
jgi:hypothetical protein